MIGTVATLVTYGRAPRATFVMKHPVKALRLMRARRNLRNTFTLPRVAMGLGAAAVTVPLGIWLGRKFGGS